MRLYFGLILFSLCLSSCKPTPNSLNVQVTTIVDSPPIDSRDLFVPTSKTGEDLTVTKLQPIKNCRIPKPRRGQGAKVVNVNAGGGHKVEKTPLYGVEIYDYGRLNPPRFRRKIKPLQVSRVVITDTSAPIYLVLSSFQATYWEIHSAPDVIIDGIYVVSDLPQAVGNAQIGKDRIAFSILDNMRSPCIDHPQLYFSVAEQLAIKPANYEYTQEDVKAYRQREKDYKRWQSSLSKRVGKISDQLSHLQVKLALVGPPPANPLVGDYKTPTIYASGPEEIQFATGSRAQAEELAETMLAGFPKE